ncbi:hypothetical protein L1887_55493 [Cichorium endivia]|nr:hypothetical protein L1887_55493 [Cichorium endivia]
MSREEEETPPHEPLDCSNSEAFFLLQAFSSHSTQLALPSPSSGLSHLGSEPSSCSTSFKSFTLLQHPGLHSSVCSGIVMKVELRIDALQHADTLGRDGSAGRAVDELFIAAPPRWVDDHRGLVGRILDLGKDVLGVAREELGVVMPLSSAFLVAYLIDSDEISTPDTLAEQRCKAQTEQTRGRTQQARKDAAVVLEERARGRLELGGEHALLDSRLVVGDHLGVHRTRSERRTGLVSSRVAASIGIVADARSPAPEAQPLVADNLDEDLLLGEHVRYGNDPIAFGRNGEAVSVSVKALDLKREAGSALELVLIFYALREDVGHLAHAKQILDVELDGLAARLGELLGVVLALWRDLRASALRACFSWAVNAGAEVEAAADVEAACSDVVCSGERDRMRLAGGSSGEPGAEADMAYLTVGRKGTPIGACRDSGMLRV